MSIYVFVQTTSGYASSTQRSNASALANNSLASAFSSNCGMETGVAIPPSGSLQPTATQLADQPGAPSASQILSANNCGTLYNYPTSTQTTPGGGGLALGDPLPYTATYNGYGYQVTYTSAWTYGGGGTYNLCPASGTNYTPVGQVRNLLIGWPAAAPVHYFPGPQSWSSLVTKAILSGASIGTTAAPIVVSPLPAAIAAGTVLFLVSGTGTYQQISVKAAAAGATNLYVQNITIAAGPYAANTSFVSTTTRPTAPLPQSSFAATPTTQVLYNNTQDGQLELSGMANGSYVVVSMPGWTPIRRFANTSGCAWFPFLPPNSQNPNTPAGPTVTYYTPNGSGGYTLASTWTGVAVNSGTLELCTVAGGCP